MTWLTRLGRRAAGPIGLAVALVLLTAPAALAAGPLGSISQLASPNNCIGTAPECGTTSTATLNQPSAVVVSPDGNNVYMLDESNSSVDEFARNPDGSLAELPAPNDCIAVGVNGCTTATGITFPNAIAISPDGKSVYVVGTDLNETGNIAEFARNANGSLTQLASPNNCIDEHESSGTPQCGTSSGHGLVNPSAVVVSPDNADVYVADRSGDAIAEFARNTVTGSLGQLGTPNNCFQETGATADSCGVTTGRGLTGAESLAISPDGNNLYVGGDDTIAELTRAANGTLSQVASSNCIQEAADNNPQDPECIIGTAVGVQEVTSLAVSRDGQNLYSSDGSYTGAIGEFARNANGVLTQLAGANNCIEENSSGDGSFQPEGCGTKTGHGLGDGGAIVVSPDGANVFVAATSDDCNEPCHAAVAEFARGAGGSLSQLPSPNDCIEQVEGNPPDCGTTTGEGLATGSPAGLAISPDSDSVYATGQGAIAEFARSLPSLTVSISGPGSGTVSDGTGAISCAPTCSHAYPIGQVVTLTANPAGGSGFAGWSGAGCAGTSTCQVTVSANTAVTATFNLQSAPTPVVTGSPPSIGGTTASFTGSVDPNGLPTTASFQYGLDPKYAGAGPVAYTQSTPAQLVGSDFTSHTVTASVSGLVPHALYDVRLVATNSGGTTFGPEVTFTTLTTPSPGAPTLGKTFNISLVNGLVLVKIHGVFVPLTELTQIPTNTVIDALHGTIKLTTALPGGSHPAHDAAAKGKKKPVKTQTGNFGGAIFKLTQATRGANKGLVNLALVESAFKGAPTYATCKAKKAGDATVASLSSKTLQLLHASAHGKFRTTGKYSAATVRGTKWTIADKCNGTLTHDITDSVSVTDFVHHKTVILHAGQSYLARKP
jgi:DNA-binding beta-propeller fold protein YncE